LEETEKEKEKLVKEKEKEIKAPKSVSLIAYPSTCSQPSRQSRPTYFSPFPSRAQPTRLRPIGMGTRNESLYAVEGIANSRCNLHGDFSYEIMWKSYTDLNNSWQSLNMTWGLQKCVY
jgi:hypothetical protein